MYSIRCRCMAALGAQQRHGLALHVRAHQARLASSCSRNGSGWPRRSQLFGRDVDVLDVLARTRRSCPRSGVDAVALEVAVLVNVDVGLGDGVLLRLPRRLVERKRLELRGRLPAASDAAVSLSTASRSTCSLTLKWVSPGKTTCTKSSTRPLLTLR